MPVIVAANGAAVKYNSGDVSVSYAVDGTKISGVDKKSEPIIYIPITNPTNTDWPIDNVKVDFAGGADGGSSTGTITDMWVYFGNTKVYHAGVSWTNTTTFTTPIPGDFKTADNPSYGILISLALKLPSTGSYIKLYSVDVTFKN